MSSRYSSRPVSGSVTRSPYRDLKFLSAARGGADAGRHAVGIADRTIRGRGPTLGHPISTATEFVMAELAAVIASTHHPFYYRTSTLPPQERPPFAEEWIAKIAA